MPDEVENHIVKKYDIKKRLGKGVCFFEKFKLKRKINNILFIIIGLWYCMESSRS
jgi:hypothetical protein